MNSGTRLLRIAGGLLILFLLAGFAAAVVPVYYRNLEFTRALGQIAAVPAASDESLRAAVVGRAALLGLAVEPAKVELSRSGGRLRIEVRYKVPVDVALYSVTLHFHPVCEK